MDLTDPLNCLTFNTLRAGRKLMRGFELVAKAHDLTAPQFAALAMLAEYGPQGVTQLGEHLGSDRTTMTRNLAVMTARGWIARVTTADARQHVFDLTPAGHQKLSDAMPAWRAYQSRLVTLLGKRDVEDVLTTLNRL
jgi:DNA-binding MarR family transcriptional regulator